MKELIRKILREQMENTVLVVFGGIDYATPEWMSSQTPTSISNNRIIIFKSHDSNIEEDGGLLDELNELEYNTLEVVGFSAGGRNVFKLANTKKLHFVGLIDPTVPISWSLDGFPTDANSILFFNNDNWSGDVLKGIKERQTLLAKAMNEKGMLVVEDKNLKHEDFPKIFFDTYMK